MSTYNIHQAKTNFSKLVNDAEIIIDTNIFSELPFHHNDPFDRLLAAQCLTEKISIITTDPIFKKYKVPGKIG